MLTSRFSVGLLALAATILTTACTSPQDTTPQETEPTSTESVESAPAESAPDPSESPASEATTADSMTRTGNFVSAEHETTGQVTLNQQEGASTLVFDQSFSTSNGPDLVVVLHRSANVVGETTPPAYPLTEADYVVVAPLKSTEGTQEYTIPAEIDLNAFQSVAVWCQEFNATFGAAPLQ